MALSMLEKITAMFMQPQTYAEAVVDAAVQAADKQTVLRAACIAGKPHFLPMITGNDKTTLLRTVEISSDRHKGETFQYSLFDDTLDTLLSNPHIDRTPSSLSDYFEVIKHLSYGGLKPDLNKDLLESPLMAAHFLAHPEAAQDKDHPHFDAVPATYNERTPIKFEEPYAFFKRRHPKVVEQFEKALDEEYLRRKQINMQSEASMESTPNWASASSFAPKPAGF